MRFILLFTFCFTLLYSPLAAPLYADSVDRSYEKAAQHFKELYRDTKFRDRADNWKKTIAAFNAIAVKYPRHKKAPKSIFNIGLLYRSLYKWNRNEKYIDQSILYFRKLTLNYPKHRLADDALYRLAENYELYKKSNIKAYYEYKRLTIKYPKGDFIQLAKNKLAALPKPKQPEKQADTTTQVASNAKTAIAPNGLYKPRYGGIPVQKSKKIKNKRLVSKVEYWSNPDWSRMVINLKGNIRYKYQALKADKAKGKQERVYIDLYKSYLPRGFQRKIAANDGLISQARIAQFDKETVRIVLDLESLSKIKVFHIGLPNQYKVVIDILGAVAVAKQEIKQPVTDLPTSLDGIKKNPPLAYDPNDVKKDSSTVSLTQALGLKVRRIILDPGHGGRDPGAIGYKTYEKTLSLKIAKALRAIIEKNHPKIEVLMTRNKDKYLSLESRTAFANKNKGDLFVSIHLNATKKKHVKGIETYYLNLTTDSDALELAATENATSLQGIGDLQGILQDLMTNSKIQESSNLAEMVQGNIVTSARVSKLLKPRNLGVKQAPFFVLLGAQMPSVLVELGFITNKKENRLLNSKKYRLVLAKGIYKGLRQYMETTNTL